MLLQILAAKLV